MVAEHINNENVVHRHNLICTKAKSSIENRVNPKEPILIARQQGVS